MKWFNVFCFSILTVLLLSCNNTDKPADSTSSKDTVVIHKPKDTATVDEGTLITIATEILTALKAKDYKAFAAYFHPTDSVLFSPYAFIDTKSAKKLTKATFTKLIEERGSVNWGNYDGSGETIRLTAQKYLEKFVYNADYLHAEKTAYNRIIGKGNSINNLSEIYPKHPFLEYYFSGFDKKYEGMDWTSLRLVFKEHQGNHYLVAVIHDQWTT
ncbi:hypothetical protein SAMN06297358_4039 [Pedobacter xixiisoli]|uniref:Uncharacterized protein n=1 Tax=Pedobacter xixiisoli TaxID=1476464 RepID=A0A286AEJ5_9SPHI|nr:hypothetical protein [Pedobacter xixiisoli]SOD20324.1 hypothetical protein SAMN06297358_4039 [Pedobacter xixiisoli]